MRLTSRALEERIETLVDLLRRDGEVDARHSVPGVSPATIGLLIEAPERRAGREMSFRYSETHEWEDGADWVLVEYVYLMASQTGAGQREYHWHPLRWSQGESVYHAHCRGAAARLEATFAATGFSSRRLGLSSCTSTRPAQGWTARISIH